MPKAYPIRLTWVAGLALSAALLLEVPGINGPWYWKWTWRDLGLIRVLAFLALPLLGIAASAALASKVPSGKPGRTAALRILALIFGSHLLLQFSAIAADPRSLNLIRRIVESPAATSYFGDARAIHGIGRWLSGFATADLGMHSSTHPPGPILFYRFFIEMVGPEDAPWAGATMIAILASLGLPVFYSFTKIWALDRPARLWGCALYALLPGLALFFPEFDQAYPLLAMAMILFWNWALRGKVRYGVYLGALLFLATFFAYNLLVLGAPLALLLLYRILQSGSPRASLWGAFRAGSAALSIWILGILAFSWATGYAPLQSFRHALENQSRLAERWARPYSACIFFDLYDFFIIGGGLVPLGLLGMAFRGEPGPLLSPAAARTLALGSILTILVVDMTGLLRAETARVWLFLQPLVLGPAARELSLCPVQERWGLLGLQSLLLALMKCKLAFVEP